MPILPKLSPTIAIKSTNPDWSGKWKISDVKQEIAELQNVKNADLSVCIEWVFSHAFDDIDIYSAKAVSALAAIEDFILENLASFRRVDFVVAGYNTSIAINY